MSEPLPHVDPKDQPPGGSSGEAYVEYGRYGRGETAVSVLLDGFTAEVSAVFDAPETGG